MLRLRSQCPSCETTPFEVIGREPFSAGAVRSYLEQYYEGRADVASLGNFDYEVVRCVRCGLAYQRAVPTDELATRIYEEWILPTEKDRLHRERELNDYRYMAEQVQFIVLHFGLKPSQLRVLDFGMGWAEWASMARAFGCEVAGSELSLHRVQHARSIGIEVLDWAEIPKRKFHFINTEQVFEHLLDPLLVLRHLKSALEANGILRISVPDSRTTLRHYARHKRFSSLTATDLVPVAPLEHVNCFESRSLIAFAQQAGLRLIRPRLRDLYDASSGWMHPRNALKLGLRPIYRHIYPKSTIGYFALPG